MKKNLLILFLSVLFTTANAQLRNYNFDSIPDTVTSATITNTSTNSFLPRPGEITDPTNFRARLRHVGNPLGYFQILNPGNNPGSSFTGKVLKVFSGGSASGAKFSIYGIPTPLPYFDLAFNFKVSSGASGNFFVAIGNEPSTSTFFSNSNNSNTTTDSILAYVRLNLDPLKHSLRSSNVVIDTTLNTGISNITNAEEYKMQLFCNGSLNSVQYTKNSTNYTITPNSYHIWFNETQLLLAANNPNFVRHNSITSFSKLNAFGIHSNGTSDAASIIFDNFAYNTTLPSLVVLPVSLTSFTAKKSSNQIQLAWSTASESNNSHFEIERSVNGTDFVKIGEKKGAGNSSSVLKYSFLDNNPATGTNYYRLKQVDFDGKFEYSDIEAASLVSTEELAIKYLGGQDPNQVKFEINTQKNANGTLVIYDLSGKRVAKQDLLLSKGANLVSLAIINLNTGVYFATCQVDGKLVSQKFVK